MRQQGINGLRGVHAGSCHAWPLPADATCATVARQVFRDAVAGVGLEPGLLDDCILMASELAANTLHARAVAGTGGGGDRLVSVAPDMGGEPISPPARPHSRHTGLATVSPATLGPATAQRRRPQVRARLPRTMALPARPRHPPRTRLQDLRLQPRLAARVGADGRPGVRPGGSRAWPADRARTVRRPVGAPSHPGPAGRLGPARQGRLVRGARAAGAREADRRHRAARVHPLGRRLGHPGQRAPQRAPGRQRTGDDAGRAGVPRPPGARRPARLRYVGPFRLPRPDRLVPVRRRVADHRGRRPGAVELRRPRRGRRADGAAIRGTGTRPGPRRRRRPSRPARPASPWPRPPGRTRRG